MGKGEKMSNASSLFRSLLLVTLFVLATPILKLVMAKDVVPDPPSRTTVFYPGSFGTLPVEIGVKGQDDICYVVRLKGHNLTLLQIVSDASGNRSELALSSARIRLASFDLHTVRAEQSKRFVKIYLTPVSQNVAAPRPILLSKELRLAVQSPMPDIRD